MSTRRQFLIQTSAMGASACALPAFAQEDKSPIRLLVGLVGGGGNDAAARLIADKLRETLGRPVIVVQKLGAGQRLALNELQKSAPDGRTLLLATSAPFSIYPHIYTKLDYDPLKEFTPIAGVSCFDVALATAPGTATNLQEMLDWIKANPKQAIYGTSPGTGSLSHFVGIQMGLAIGVPMTHVAYKQSNTGLLDVATGRLPMMMTGMAGMIELHKAGKIRALASSGSTRSPLLTEVPTMMEAGLNVNTTTNVGIFGPAGMPPEIVRSLSETIVAFARTPEFREKLLPFNVLPKPATPQELTATLQAEHKLFGGLVKSSGMVPE
jgi:tripartite-type tricarboxylate transporter receptor subunit TctC